MEVFQTDGETILHLVQANNGDAPLDKLLPSETSWNTEFVLRRYQGAARPAAPLRNTDLTAEIVKADRERGEVWLQAAEEIDRWEDGSPVYRAVPGAPCLLCPAAPAVFDTLGEACQDPAFQIGPDLLNWIQFRRVRRKKD